LTAMVRLQETALSKSYTEGTRTIRTREKISQDQTQCRNRIEASLMKASTLSKKKRIGGKDDVQT
jgi:hypothetical protein